MKKIVALFLLILIITGAFLWSRSKRVKGDKYTSQSNVGDINIDGWSGFQDESANSLSFINPSTGAKVTYFIIDYDVLIKPSEEIDKGTIS